MKTSSVLKLASVALLAASFLAPTRAWARLPKPIQATGVVLAADLDSKTLVVKFAKGEKPVLLDWDDKTEFVRAELVVTPSDLKVGMTVMLTYKNVSFHNARLKRVILTEHTKST